MKGYLVCSLACLLMLPATTSLSATPVQTSTSSMAIIGELPTLTFGRSEFALPLMSSGLTLAGRTTPLLDQFFANRLSSATFVHRHSYQLDLGSTTLGIEALRLQNRTVDWMSRLDGTRDRRKSWSFGARSDFAIGQADHLSFGLATSSDHGLQPRLPVSDPRATTSIKTLGLTWLHGGRWLTSLGWQQTSGTSRGPTDRMIALAAGAPLHEKGMHFSLAFLPGGGGDPHSTSLGLEGRRASISAGDLAMIGAPGRQDTQASLFLRTHF